MILQLLRNLVCAVSVTLSTSTAITVTWSSENPKWEYFRMFLLVLRSSCILRWWSLEKILSWILQNFGEFELPCGDDRPAMSSSGIDFPLSSYTGGPLNVNFEY